MIDVEIRVYVDSDVYHHFKLSSVPRRGDFVVVPDHTGEFEEITTKVADVTWVPGRNQVVVGVDVD